MNAGEYLANVERSKSGDRIDDDVPLTIAVEVENSHFNRDKLMKYFGKTGNGGGDIKSLIYPYEYKGRNVAVIEFEDRKCAESLITKQSVTAVIRNEHVTLNISKFEEVITSGSINLNHSLYERIKSNSHDLVVEILEESGVEINKDTYVIKGEWYKLVHVKKKLDDLVHVQGKTLPQHNNISGEQINLDSDIKDQTSFSPDHGSDMSSRPIKELKDNSIELGCYEICTNKLILRVLQGNIVDQNATAIVNAANKFLHGGGGVTGAIYNAGGHEFQRRCREVMRKRDNRPLGTGEVVVTEACGKLICKSVLHAAAPIYFECENELDCQKKMLLTCYQLFSTAESMQFESVSIPAMGTGIYAVPVPVFCKALILSIKDICEDIRNNKVKYLKEIRLVNYDKYEARQIALLLSHELKVA